MSSSEFLSLDSRVALHESLFKIIILCLKLGVGAASQPQTHYFSFSPSSDWLLLI